MCCCRQFLLLLFCNHGAFRLPTSRVVPRPVPATREQLIPLLMHVVAQDWAKTTAYFRLHLLQKCREKVYRKCQNSAGRHNSERPGFKTWKLDSRGETHERVLMVVKTDQHQVKFVAAENLPEVFWKRFTVFAKGSKTSSRFSFLTCILQVNVTSIKVVETLDLRKAKTQRGLNKPLRCSPSEPRLCHSGFLLLFIANGAFYERLLAINCIKCTSENFNETLTADC